MTGRIPVRLVAARRSVRNACFAGGFLAATVLFVGTPIAHAANYPPSTPPAATQLPTAPSQRPGNMVRGTIDDARPVAGKTITVVGQGFEAGETVSVAVHGGTNATLGEAVAGADGMASLTVATTASLRGSQAIILTGIKSGRVASINVTFLPPPDSVQSNATTQAVVVVGVGALGVVLISGGIALLVVGRRHTVLLEQ